ncbi:MAG: hypothetical protein MJZ81_11895 [Bacteroidales bacterium]|nr:hypothetical protein [Bacteroidales bacterium]
MKTIEELGISPTPWSVEVDPEYGDTEVKDINGHTIALVFSWDTKIDADAARLIKASPELYEAGDSAYDALEGLCPWFGKCVKCLHGYRVAKDGEWLDSNTVYCNKSDREDCMVYIALSKLRAALAEASGEVVK